MNRDSGFGIRDSRKSGDAVPAARASRSGGKH